MHISNTHGRGSKSPQWFLIAVAALGVTAFATPARAQSIAAAFKAQYHLNNIGIPAGLSTPSGAIAFASGNPNLLYVTNGADTGSGAIYSTGVTRDGNQHITGFSGTLTRVASTPDIDAGLVIGPGGVGFYTTYPDNVLGEILPGGTGPATTVNLSNYGIVASTGGLGLVPPGFPDAGHLKITSFDRGAMYDAALSSAGNGTYNVSSVSSTIEYFSSSAESSVFIPSGNPDFSGNTVLMCNYTYSSVQACPADSNANPIFSSRQDFITGIASAAGIVIDPLTHDVLVEDQGTNGILVVSGFANAALSSLSPASATAGTSFTLTVNGSGFLPGATVLWNGTALSTTVTGTKLTASVPSSINGLLSTYPGSAAISVLNADGTKSNTLSFSVAAPAATITALLPSSVKANSALTLTVQGTNFRTGAVICWNGTNLPTTVYGTTDMTARVPQSVNAFAPSYPTTATIMVINPGSLTNPTASLPVTEPAPVFNSVTPSVVPVGQGTFSLNVYGAGYENGAKVNWNGVALPTFYISSTHLTATVSSLLVASPASVAITITNATTGGTSGARTLLVQATTITFVQGISSRNANTGVISLPLYILNTGNATASSLKITGATVNNVATSVPVPISLGNLAPNGLAVTTLTFPGSAGTVGTSQKLAINGTYTGGVFQYSATVTLP